MTVTIHRNRIKYNCNYLGYWYWSASVTEMFTHKLSAPQQREYNPTLKEKVHKDRHILDRSAKFEAFVHVVGEPVLDSHVPATHPSTHCRSEVCPKLINVVNGLEVVFCFLSPLFGTVA